jgi:MFS family permease
MGWLIIFVTWGYVNSFGSFQAYYTSVLPESPSTISWIGSIQVFLTFFIGAFSGRLLDAGLFVPTLFVGGVLQLLGIFMMSLSTKWWQLLLSQGVLTGIGGGIFFCPSMGLIATYFSKRRALAVGVVTTGNSVGSLSTAFV